MRRGEMQGGGKNRKERRCERKGSRTVEWETRRSECLWRRGERKSQANDDLKERPPQLREDFFLLLPTSSTPTSYAPFCPLRTPSSPSAPAHDVASARTSGTWAPLSQPPRRRPWGGRPCIRSGRRAQSGCREAGRGRSRGSKRRKTGRGRDERRFLVVRRRGARRSGRGRGRNGRSRRGSEADYRVR